MQRRSIQNDFRASKALFSKPLIGFIGSIFLAAFSLLSSAPLFAAGIGEDGALTKPLVSVTPYAAPELRLEDLDGDTLAVNQWGKDAVLVINFWATWCPPCRAEMGSLETLHQALQNATGGQAQVIGVNVGEDADTVFSFLGEVTPSPTFKQLLDTSGQAVEDWGVKGLPTTFVVNRQGQVVYRVIGGREFNTPIILQQIESLSRP